MIRQAMKRRGMYFFNSTNILVGIRFTARLMVIGLFAIFIFLFMTEPASRREMNPFGLAPYETLLILSFYLMLFGLLISWKLEGLGGLLTLLGLAAFTIVYYALKGSMIWNIWILAIPAALFLLCWWFTNNNSSSYDVYRK